MMAKPTDAWAGAMWWAQTTEAYAGLFCMSPDGQTVLQHESTWANLSPAEAIAILKPWTQDILGAWPLRFLVMQPSCFPSPGEYGPTVSEDFTRAGFPVRRGSEDLAASMTRLREWLRPRGLAAPWLSLHARCGVALAALQNAELDPAKPEQIAITADAPPVLAMGFYVMCRPISGPKPEELWPDDAIGWELKKLREELR